jgi:hypothetical protein
VYVFISTTHRPSKAQDHGTMLLIVPVGMSPLCTGTTV